MAENASIAGIVLAAGFSRRLGRPKQLVTLAGETLMARAAGVAREAGLSPVLIVLNPALRELAERAITQLQALGDRVLFNEHAAEGMASSIHCGLEALGSEPVAGAVVMTCDQVAVTPAHIQALCAEPMEIAGSGYAGKAGVPAYFPASRFADLLALQGDQGARELLREARCVSTEALALDVDTEEGLARAEQWLAGTISPIS